MKVLSFKCPDCSARMRINETDTRAVCEYCGHVMLLKDEARRYAHQFEDETHAAHAKLADKINALLAPVADLQRAREVANARKTTLDASHRTLAKRVSFIGKAKVFIIPVFLGLLMLLDMVKSNSPQIEFGPAGFLALIALIPAYIIRFIRMTILKLKIKREENAYYEVLANIHHLENTPDLQLIPEPYRTTQHIREIVTLLKTRRADTILQAVNQIKKKAN